MSIFSSIFSKKEIVKNVLDPKDGLLTQFGSWVGGMHLSEEETLKINVKTISDVSAFVVDTMSESTDRSKARRTIAVMWIKLQASLILMTAITIPFNSEWSAAYFALATSYLMMATTSAIVVFFFGSHGIAKFQERQNKKKG